MSSITVTISRDSARQLERLLQLVDLAITTQTDLRFQDLRSAGLNSRDLIAARDEIKQVLAGS